MRNDVHAGRRHLTEPQRTTTQDDVRRLAEARWQQIERERPDLAAAISLQRELLGRVAEVANALDAAGWRPPFIEPRSVSACVRGGRSLLQEHAVEIPRDIVEPALFDICLLLEEGGAGEPARHVRDVLHEGRLNPGSLLCASLARRQGDIRTGATQLGLAPDLVWLVAELSVGPVAHAFQRATLEGVDLTEEVRSALEAWTLGRCPACGSWPALAERTADGTLVCRCSFCGSRWRLAGTVCPYCAASEPQVKTIKPLKGHPDWRLLTCGGCQGYLKVVDADESIPWALLPVEDLATTALDVDAMERGLTRPPMPDATADDAGCGARVTPA